MSTKWYFASAKQTFGPFSAAQLQEFAVSGRLQRQDTVWKEGMETGVLATKVKHLFAVASVSAAPAVGSAAAVPDPAIRNEPESPPIVPAAPITPTDEGPEKTPEAPKGDRHTLSEEAADRRAESSGGLRPQPEVAKKRRVIGVKGGVLSSQDGEVVKYRKVCLKCKYADTSMTTMRIRSGTTRVNFFCPKCRKSQQCEIQGVG